MLYDIEIDKAIVAMVEGMFPRFSDPSLLFHVVMDVSFDDYGYDEKGMEVISEPWHPRFQLEFLFHRPHNYTKVFYRELDFTDDTIEKDRNNKPIRFKKTSDHDSCWSSDGFSEMKKFFYAIRDIYEEQLPGRDYRRHLSTHISFSIFSKPKFLEIKTFTPIYGKLKNGMRDSYAREYDIEVSQEVKLPDVFKRPFYNKGE